MRCSADLAPWPAGVRCLALPTTRHNTTRLKSVRAGWPVLTDFDKFGNFFPSETGGQVGRVGLWPGGQVGLVARWPGCALARGCAGALGAFVHKYLHCFVFICGRQASGRWIDVAIPRLRINWESLLRLSEMWYFRPQQSLRRTDNTSVLSSGTHEKAALSGRLADRLRLPVASWAGRRSQGTLG